MIFAVLGQSVFRHSEQLPDADILLRILDLQQLLLSFVELRQQLWLSGRSSDGEFESS